MKIEQTLRKEMHERAAVQEDNQDKLLAQENVRGVALGNRIKGGRETDEPVISVFVAQKLAPDLLAEKDRVPAKLKGVATDVVEVGEIFAGGGPSVGVAAPAGPAGTEVYRREEHHRVSDTMVEPQTLRRRVRPARGGYSVGHFRITAGTLGTCCYDLEPFPSIPQRYYILSNNHVLANSNDANLGDPILQPGPIDGGQAPREVIARLSRFVPIRYISGDQRPCNFVDAAIAEGDFEDLDREIYWIGHLKRLYVAPAVGDVVQKPGARPTSPPGRCRASTPRSTSTTAAAGWRGSAGRSSPATRAPGATRAAS